MNGIKPNQVGRAGHRPPLNEPPMRWCLKDEDFVRFLWWRRDDATNAINRKYPPYSHCSQSTVRHHLKSFFDPAWVITLTSVQVASYKAAIVKFLEEPLRVHSQWGMPDSNVSVSSAVAVFPELPPGHYVVNQIQDSYIIERKSSMSNAHAAPYANSIVGSHNPTIEHLTLVYGTNVATANGEVLLNLLAQLNNKRNQYIDSDAQDTKYVAAEIKSIDQAILVVKKRLNKLG